MQRLLESRDTRFKVVQIALLIHAACFQLIDSSLEVIHLQFHHRMCWIVIGESICGFEIDQSSYSLRVAAADGTQFFTGKGMPNQYRMIELERVDHGEHVIAETVGCVVGAGGNGFAGCAKAASRDAVDV